MEDDEERQSSLALDPVVPVLIEQKLPVTFENWILFAGYEPDDLEDAEVMSSIPWEIAELDEGEAIHPWRFYEAVAELPRGIPPMGGPVDRKKLFWAKVRLWGRQLLRWLR